MTDGNSCKRGACYKVAQLNPDLILNRPDQVHFISLSSQT